MACRPFFSVLLCGAIAFQPAAFAADFHLPDLSQAGDGSAALHNEPIAAPEGTVDLSGSIDAAFKAADSFPAARYEVAALAESLGKDPAAAFTWVRDHVRFDPYAGQLRSPEAVLAASGGNAADRAALLKALFDAMGIKSRFAMAKPDDAAKTRLTDAVFAARAGGAVPDASAVFNPAFLDAIAARARHDAAILVSALGQDSFAASEGAPISPLTALDQPHVWVQTEINGAWVDYDTTFADAAIGTQLAKPTSTPEKLDAGQQQMVTIEVVASNKDGDQHVLKTQLPASEAAAQQLLLYFEPDRTGQGAAIAGDGGYLPVLLANGEAVRGKVITGSSSGGGLGGAIDMLDGGGSSQAGLTALSLIITTTGPGLEPITTQHVLAGADPDGMLPANDRNILYALSWIHHITVSNGGQSPREYAVVKGAAADFVARELATPEQLQNAALPAMMWPSTSADLALPAVSERMFIESLNTPDQRAFVARPRVFIVSSGANPGKDRPEQDFMTDLMLDGAAIISRSGASTMQARFWYGALQAALETEYALLRLSALAPSGRAMSGASLALTAGTVAVLDQKSAPPSAPKAMLDDLASGARVIVAGDPVAATSWWTVQADGAVRAVLDPSFGGIGGGGFGVTPAGYVNSTPSTTTYVIDEATGNTIAEIRNGQRYAMRNAARARSTCGGGSEYMIVAGCVSIPNSYAYAILAGEVAIFVVICAYIIGHT